MVGRAGAVNELCKRALPRPTVDADYPQERRAGYSTPRKPVGSVRRANTALRMCSTGQWSGYPWRNDRRGNAAAGGRGFNPGIR